MNYFPRHATVDKPIGNAVARVTDSAPIGRSANVARATLRIAGELLITIGLIAVLFAGYEVWGKALIIRSHQHNLDQRLDQSWAAAGRGQAGSAAVPPPLAPLPGDALARLYVPSLHGQWVVVEGVSLDDIRYAPGHYPNSAAPGEIGNFAVAGHRTPGMFWDLDKLGSGDEIIVETQQSWYVYELYQSHIVQPDAFAVIAPTPNEPGAAPTSATITLTTCNPKWDNYQRLVVHGRLTQTMTHDQRPTQLQR